jgi:hypothetical protein
MVAAKERLKPVIQQGPKIPSGAAGQRLTWPGSVDVLVGRRKPWAKKDLGTGANSTSNVGPLALLCNVKADLPPPLKKPPCHSGGFVIYGSQYFSLNCATSVSKYIIIPKVLCLPCTSCSALVMPILLPHCKHIQSTSNRQLLVSMNFIGLTLR